MQGKIIMVNDRGFGFIKDTNGKDLFFHASAVANADFKDLCEGDAVEFEQSYDDRRGKMRADPVRVL